MKLFNTTVPALLFGALMLAPLTQLALAAQATSVSASDFKAGKARISADYKADKAACASFSDNARDICIEEGRAKEKVARAELQHSYSGTQRDQNKLEVARAEAIYAVAKERCDDMSGNDKSVCVKEAKAVEKKALADAKIERKVEGAITDSANTQRDAEYKVAAQKCESMMGDAKASCMTAAKAKFGKS